MNIVTFPGLNLKFEFSPIAFHIFGIDVYKYAVCIVLGILVALILCKLSKEKYDVEFDFAVENLIIGIVLSVGFSTLSINQELQGFWCPNLAKRPVEGEEEQGRIKLRGDRVLELVWPEILSKLVTGF